MTSNTIDKFRSLKAKISYRDNGRDHILFGYIIEVAADSFIVKPDDFGDNVVIPKKSMTSIVWPKHRDNVDTAQIHKDDFSNLKPKNKKKQSKRFSYARWWKDCNVKEAEP